MITLRCIKILSLFNYKTVTQLIVFIVGIFVIHYCFYFEHHTEYPSLSIPFNLSTNVQIVNLTAPLKVNFQCIPTKVLLSNISTHICLHSTKKDKYISRAFQPLSSIWEEEQVIRILQILSRHPHLHFIDIGANIGAYTMFVASLGRFVLAIDCFQPNILRLTRAIQLAYVINRVVLVQNAIFTQSGQFVRLSVDTTNIGGQTIALMNNRSVKYHTKTNHSLDNPYIVRTITFDDLLPILQSHGIFNVIIKMDIEGSESFVIESGQRIFETLNVLFIQMEWKLVRLQENRMRIILDFLLSRHYFVLTSSCQILSFNTSNLWPDEVYCVKENISNFCS